MGNNFKKLEQTYNEYFFFHIKHNLLNNKNNIYYNGFRFVDLLNYL